MSISRDELKDLRRYLRANCPTLKVTAGRGTWWRLTHVSGSDKDWKFSEDEIQFLSQLGFEVRGFSYSCINMYQAEKIIEEVIRA